MLNVALAAADLEAYPVHYGTHYDEYGVTATEVGPDIYIERAKSVRS